MIQIVDINTNSNNLQEVERLKVEFREYLGPTVKEGTVIIVSNFPAVGNFTGKIDYIFFIAVQKNQGYLRINRNGKNNNIDSLILCVKKIHENDIIKADDSFIYNKDGDFDYNFSIKSNNYEFQDYCEKFEKVRSSVTYSITSAKDFQYYNSRISINHPLTAKYIIWSAATQYLEKFGEDYRINSFEKEYFSNYTHDNLVEFVKNIVDETDRKSIYGILTKKKLDRITTSIKVVDEIYENIGNKLSIISGKAGTGKTLTLTRVIHKHAQNNHNIRFLTFNNLLVFDIKQCLRNFGYFGDTKISISTVHHFFYTLSDKLGIRLIMNESRLNELMAVCKLRIEKLEEPFNKYFSNNSFYNKDEFLKSLPGSLRNEIDYDEFREFARFLNAEKNLTDFFAIKQKYLDRKKSILLPNVGSKNFIEDYYKALELIYIAVTDSQKFYDEQGIKNRYDLLSVLYNTDKFVEDGTNEIPFRNFVAQVKSLRRNTNWSKLLIIDECQDFHFYEKEILYTLRGSENLVVASGGKEQLIRHSKMLDWSVSLSKKISHQQFSLTSGSYRQKQNIITFVNKFSELFGLGLSLKSVSESKGLGKVIIDTRPKTEMVNEEIAIELKNNGEINKCSGYESVTFLIPSKNYTHKTISESFVVNEKDYVSKTDVSKNRKTLNLEVLDRCGYFSWDGVSENKSKLKIPFQSETRIIHYESCRGLESWSVGCMSLDEYFNFKRTTTEAENHLADDLFLTEDERRDKYAAIWCLMAFTRPIDTLYIHIEKADSEVAKKIIDTAKKCEGVTIY